MMSETNILPNPRSRILVSDEDIKKSHNDDVEGSLHGRW